MAYSAPRYFAPRYFAPRYFTGSIITSPGSEVALLGTLSLAAVLSMTFDIHVDMSASVTALPTQIGEIGMTPLYAGTLWVDPT